jgi:hypothetical protein
MHVRQLELTDGANSAGEIGDASGGRRRGNGSLQTDPEVASSWNSYAYAENNPVLFTDMEGLRCNCGGRPAYYMTEQECFDLAAKLQKLVDILKTVLVVDHTNILEILKAYSQYLRGKQMYEENDCPTRIGIETPQIWLDFGWFSLLPPSPAQFAPDQSVLEPAPRSIQPHSPAQAAPDQSVVERPVQRTSAPLAPHEISPEGAFVE